MPSIKQTLPTLITRSHFIEQDMIVIVTHHPIISISCSSLARQASCALSNILYSELLYCATHTNNENMHMICLLLFYHLVLNPCPSSITFSVLTCQMWWSCILFQPQFRCMERFNVLKNYFQLP